MRVYPVDVEVRVGYEPVIVLSDGTQKPLSKWMRQKLDQRSDAPIAGRVEVQRRQFLGEESRFP